MQVFKNGLNESQSKANYDLVIAGAGGAGLAAALFAAMQGASVLIVESTEFVGGTSAISAGTSWIPCSHHNSKLNPSDDLDTVNRYLDAAVGNLSNKALRQAFLNQGAATVRELEEKTEVKYRPYPKHPDYMSELEGSSLNGRALEPLPFDGRLLGDLFALLRPPIPEFTVLGGMMVDRTDINHLLSMTKSWASLKHSAKILARHAADRLRYPRGTRLVMGNAYIARLLYSLSKYERVSLILRAEIGEIIQSNEQIEAVQLKNSGTQIKVNKALVLASGGFNRHPELRKQMLPHIAQNWCPAAPGHTGQMHEKAKAVGAVYGQGAHSHAFWAPVSLRKRTDGSTAAFPHFVMDRAKPGVIAVNSRGERFLNESTSYHLFGLGMQEAHQTAPSIPAYLIADARALKQYGLGMVRPGGKGLQGFIADGYLIEAPSISDLAKQLQMNEALLQTSITQMNECAETGVDSHFHRGETAYQQNLGDAAWNGKNPNLGALKQAPYYAIRLVPGDIGAATGFATNEHAQVLNAQNEPIEKLYAIGNDMHSIMGGVYPAPGITLGPGLVFASIAAKHAMNTNPLSASN